ncbi:MAG: DUF2341 domain-containing protein [Leptospiraceae bacterium]|nr:DUF2341 domain-containing protein [Leptospiraceae bacterium]
MIRFGTALLGTVLLLGAVSCAPYTATESLLGLLLVNSGSPPTSTPSGSANWWNSAWRLRRSLQIDNSSHGALADFPILVQLNNSRIDYSQAAADGSDLCFVSATAAANSAPLAHEIESWDNSGTSIVWLKVPSINANSNTEVIYMYYGGPGCATTASAVWSSSYQTVWHLNGSLQDSTANSNHLSNSGATPVGAKMAQGYSFNGSGNQLEDADGELYINGQTALSFSAWIKAATVGSDKGIFITDSPSGADDRHGLRFDQSGVSGGCTNYFKAGTNVSGSTMQQESSSSVQSTDWTLVHLVWQSGQSFQFYRNGVLDTPSFNSGAPAGSLSNASTVLIGKGAKDTGANSWNGLIDEVRISNAAQSADWISAQYASMSDSYLLYGSVDQNR